jgi:hypothetical protein
MERDVAMYDVRSGRRVVSCLDANTPRQALVEYLRGLGCHDDEIRCMGPSVVAWRGGVFTAEPAATSDHVTREAA